MVPQKKKHTNPYGERRVPEHQGASVCSTFDPEMKVATPNRALGDVN